MRQLIFSLFIASICVAMQSCQVKTSEVPILSEENTVMVDGRFAVGAQFSVYLQYAQPLTNFTPDNPILIPDAIVNIYEDGAFLESLTYNGNGFYFSSNVAQEGKLYKLEIITKDQEIVTAESVSPTRRVVVANDVVRRAGTFNDGSEYALWRVSFSDPQDEQNYYGVQFIAYDEFETLSLCWDSDDPLVSNLKQIDPFSNDNSQSLCGIITFSDDIINQGLATLNAQLPENELLIKDTLIFELYSLSEDLYEYDLALSRQDQQNQDGGILFGEPTTIPSNVTNGIGIFAGYIKSTVSKPL